MSYTFILCSFVCLLPSLTNSLQCQSGIKFSINVPGEGQPIGSELTNIECPGLNSQCLRVDFEVQLSGITVPYVLGQCVPNGGCSAITCDDVTSRVSEQLGLASSIIFNSCSASCCSTNNCNGDSTAQRTSNSMSDINSTASSVEMSSTYATSLPEIISVDSIMDTLSTLSPPSGSLQCQTGVQFSLRPPGVGPIESDLITSECSRTQDRCLRVELNASLGELTVPYVVGQCVSQASCTNTSCEQIISTIQQQQLTLPYTFNSCTTSCCSTNNCNSETNLDVTGNGIENSSPVGGVSAGSATMSPGSITPETIFDVVTSLPSSFGSISCQAGVQFSLKIPGSSTVTSELTTTLCPGVGYQCLRVEFDAVVSGIKIPYVVGQCVPNGGCSAITCSQITSSIESQQLASGAFSISGCSKSCCSTNNCNANPIHEGDSIRTTTQSILEGLTTSLATPTGGLQCQTGVEFSISFLGLPPRTSQLTTTACPGLENRCLRVEFDISLAGRKVSYVVGQCTVESECSSETCDVMTSRVTSQLPSIPFSISSCSFSCCSTNNCNRQPINETIQFLSTESMDSTSGSPAPVDFTEQIVTEIMETSIVDEGEEDRIQTTDNKAIVDNVGDTFTTPDPDGSANKMSSNVFLFWFYSLYTIVLAVQLV